MMDAKIDWSSIRLVAFDVDGTLYDQRAMSLRMLREIAGNVVETRSLKALRVLHAYRRLRESIGDDEIDGFDDVLVARTAEANGVAPETVRAIVAEWIEKRPLAHIRACRYPNIVELFSALNLKGKTIGILSDYPAISKLSAMELTADHVVAAGDANVGILKPHPRGLEVLMKAAGASPAETILIGDRIERDGAAARRAGATALIRSARPLDGWLRFSTYSDALFAPLFDRPSG
ncbi:HAD family hydrolase [Hyphomicrobium facile]|uniref:phosphoglycolate phosphatase n=1 Tax=Hyphomicrobium facile TaxID=51670 RepID=A0A1I7NFQ4_9HYPH|nr:HAD family hydrolase [Hyphomicrobium facile]SFV33433.1 putative hydrolase of the HAD superfamily [Hyphomicrobium facile]